MLQSWPGHVHPKVPSVFTYDPSRNRDTQWGFNARSSPNKFLHTKLELDRNGRKQELQLVKDLLTKIRFPQGPNNRQTLPATSHLAHDPVTVVSDYLGRIRQYLMKELESRFNETELREFAVEIIISVPAVSQTATLGIKKTDYGDRLGLWRLKIEHLGPLSRLGSQGNILRAFKESLWSPNLRQLLCIR